MRKTLASIIIASSLLFGCHRQPESEISPLTEEEKLEKERLEGKLYWQEVARVKTAEEEVKQDERVKLAQTFKSVYSNNQIMSLAIGDLNNDGTNDIAYSISEATPNKEGEEVITIYSLINKGNGTYSPQILTNILINKR